MWTRVLALGALALAGSLPALGQDTSRLDPGDEKALRELGATFARRWNAGDAKGLAKLFDVDQGRVRVSATQIVRGKDEIARWFKARPKIDVVRLTPELHELRSIASGLAEFDLGVEGAAPVQGIAPSWTLTVLRDENAWRVTRLQRGAHPTTGGVRVGGTIMGPRKVTHMNPTYPAEAKAARVQGAVVLECQVSTEGQITDIDPLLGDPMLVPAAMEAVKQWVYTPTLLNDVPVPVIMTVTVNFRLQ